MSAIYSAADEDQNSKTARCVICNTWKQFDEFKKTNRRHHVRKTRFRCIACDLAARGSVRKERIDSFSDEELSKGVRKCNVCLIEKPTGQFNYRDYKGTPKTNLLCKCCERERKRAYYDKSRELNVNRAKRKKSTKDGRAKSMFYSIKTKAKSWNLEFTLTQEWMAERLMNGCEVTGIEFLLSAAKGKRNLLAPSVDRTDPTKGYTIENCKMVVLGYNLAKSDASHQDVMKIAKALVAFEKTKQPKIEGSKCKQTSIPLF